MARKVVVDYGHGGIDPGAVDGNLVERDMNLIAGEACCEVLRRHNVLVRKTRTTNQENPSFGHRVAIANDWGADLFLSVHFNAGGGERGEAIHSIFGGAGAELAQKVVEEFEKEGQPASRVFTRRNTQGTDFFAVIRRTRMPAVICEGAFIDHSRNRQLVDTVAKQRAFGVAIARAALRQLGIPYVEESSASASNNLKQGEFYRVQVGAYSVEQNAINMKEELESKGYSAIIRKY